MFGLSEEPLDLAALRADIRNVEAGGYAAFEGWVRNHNEGKEVRSLEYEAYPAVALKEGQRIIAEAREKFGFLEAACVHRTGHLGLEDIAVWVGVASAHRGEAFSACRYIIDEIKHRVPIWKKEHYVDGNSGWVNCEHCAAPHSHEPHAHPHGEKNTVRPEEYYARQINLPELGTAGQETLARARVLVVGAGGLGAAALPALAAAGVGHIGICDSDVVEVSNLHRQTIFTVDDVGQPKATRAADYLRARNPFVAVDTFVERATPANIESLFQGYDLILDCTDNFETKFLLNDAAVTFSKVLVQASIYQYEGQLFVVDPQHDSPCLRCVWPEMPEPGCVGSCAEAGVLGAVPAVFGALQAMETLKLLLDLPRQSKDAMIFFDLLSLRSRHVAIAHRAANCVCQTKAPLQHWDSTEDIERVWEAARESGVPMAIVDIREQDEQHAAPFEYVHLSAPASTFVVDQPPFQPDEAVLLCCSRGMRSRYLAMALRNAGYKKVYSLKHGINALSRADVR